MARFPFTNLLLDFPLEYTIPVPVVVPPVWPTCADFRDSDFAFAARVRHTFGR